MEFAVGLRQAAQRVRQRPRRPDVLVAPAPRDGTIGDRATAALGIGIRNIQRRPRYTATHRVGSDVTAMMNMESPAG